VVSKQPIVTKPAKLEGYAVWYDVPANSLAKRRAGKDELTAAHNRLPLGTRVRVTHLGNGKNVVVRITDRGITRRRALIDLCKEAAVKLDMVREGSARVRLEILPEEPLPASKKAPPW
jgi:rare lipoprotein A